MLDVGWQFISMRKNFKLKKNFKSTNDEALCQTGERPVKLDIETKTKKARQQTELKSLKDSLFLLGMVSSGKSCGESRRDSARNPG